MAINGNATRCIKAAQHSPCNIVIQHGHEKAPVHPVGAALLVMRGDKRKDESKVNDAQGGAFSEKEN
ncbi:hypothetical protein P0C22_08435 [Plesiomonas shigelloides]|uniref:hypothetical protein n=1 Tax=Plesiomonas shigelloides TaxID=703 RepID=UPI0030BFA127